MSIENLQHSFDDFFESLYQNSRMNAIVLMDLEGNIITVNKAFTKSFGYTAHELAGKNFRIFFTEEDQDAHRPEYELQAVIQSGQADDKNFLVNNKNEKVWVSGETVLIKQTTQGSLILKIIQDINEQKKAELAAQQANDFNEGILTSIDDIVIVLNKNLDVVSVNSAFHALFSQNSPTKVLTNFKSFINQYDLQGNLLENIQTVLENGKSFSNFEMEIPTRQTDRVFSISGRPLQLSQQPDSVLLVIHEVTMQKQAEREREDIIGFVAHELRNPLSNVTLCNELMKEILKRRDIDKALVLLEQSQHNIMRLHKMIADLYDATKISSGNFNLEITLFDFDEMIREAVKTVNMLQPAFNLKIEGEVGMASGDKYRLMQVVTNYLTNGVKYSNGHSTIILNTQIQNGNITVSVRDYGLGIAASQVPHLFARFFRAEKAKNLEGIGLGLFLCRRIIDAHKGKVWAESEEGKGSIFYFSIPVTQE